MKSYLSLSLLLLLLASAGCPQTGATGTTGDGDGDGDGDGSCACSVTEVCLGDSTCTTRPESALIVDLCGAACGGTDGLEAHLETVATSVDTLTEVPSDLANWRLVVVVLDNEQPLLGSAAPFTNAIAGGGTLVFMSDNPESWSASVRTELNATLGDLNVGIATSDDTVGDNGCPEMDGSNVSTDPNASSLVDGVAGFEWNSAGTLTLTSDGAVELFTTDDGSVIGAFEDQVVVLGDTSGLLFGGTCSYGASGYKRFFENLWSFFPSY